MFQFPVVYDTMTVAREPGVPAEEPPCGDRQERGRAVEQIARLLDLTRVLDRKARDLTADMKQKISLGRGLVRSDVGGRSCSTSR